jgi:hypothetical protein
VIGELVDRLLPEDRCAPAADAVSMATRACRGAWLLLVGMLLVRPAIHGIGMMPTPRPGADVEGVAPARSLVLIESPLDFMPLVHYQRRGDLDFVLPDPRTLSSSADAPPRADFIYNYMDVLRAHGYVRSAGPAGAAQVCTSSPFVVFQSSGRHRLAQALGAAPTLALSAVPQGGDDRILLAVPRGKYCVAGWGGREPLAVSR